MSRKMNRKEERELALRGIFQIDFHAEDAERQPFKGNLGFQPRAENGKGHPASGRYRAFIHQGAKGDSD